MTLDSILRPACMGCCIIGTLTALAAATGVCCSDQYTISNSNDPTPGPCSPGFIQICEWSYTETSPGRLKNSIGHTAQCVDLTVVDPADITLASCESFPGPGWCLIAQVGGMCCYVSTDITINGPYNHPLAITVYPCDGEVCE